MDSAAYLKQLQTLLPPGEAFSLEPDAVMTSLLQALADELARVDGRVEDLIKETDPRTIYELLPDMERVAGLPDQCQDAAETIAERRMALQAKLTNTGGQSRQFFIDIAATLGLTITITELGPFQWQANVQELSTVFFRAGSGVAGEPLRVWGQEAYVECLFLLLKPAHTEVTFNYL